MKKTAKSRLCFIGELLFFIVAPIVLIWVQYGDVHVAWYKMSMTGIGMILFILLIAKKIFLSPLIQKVALQVAQIETQQLSVIDPIAITSNKKRFRKLSMWQLFFNSLLPILIFGGLIITIKVVEAGAIKMFGVLVLCAISLFLGIICRIGEIYSLRCEHEK